MERVNIRNQIKIVYFLFSRVIIVFNSIFLCVKSVVLCLIYVVDCLLFYVLWFCIRFIYVKRYMCLCNVIFGEKSLCVNPVLLYSTSNPNSGGYFTLLGCVNVRLIFVPRGEYIVVKISKYFR